MTPTELPPVDILGRPVKIYVYKSGRVGYGAECDYGALPAYSVQTEREALNLIAMACPLDWEGHYYSPQVSKNRTVDSLLEFSRHLRGLYELMLRGRASRLEDEIANDEGRSGP